MSNFIKVLVVLLVAQFVVAVVRNYQDGQEVAPDRNALLADGPGLIDKIIIESDKAKVTLEREKGRWQLSDQQNALADASKVAALFRKLEGIKLGMPTTKDAVAQNQYKVAENNFERRVTLIGARKTLTTLYLGNTKVDNAVYVRRGMEKEIYSIAFDIHDLPVKTTDWQVKKRLRAITAKPT